MKKPLVSLIIPMYNAELFIDECLKSVLAQTYTNLEIVIVDDNSTDASAKIVRSYMLQNENIKYIKTKNGNAAKTRRDGVAKASGDLICFVDADDIVDEKYVEILHSTMLKTRTDMAVCKLETFSENITQQYDTLDRDQYILESTAWSFANHYHISAKNKLTLQTMHCKMFKKQLFDSIDYTVLIANIFEDNFIMAQIMRKIKSIGVTDAPLYWYRQTHGGTSDKTLMTAVEYRGSTLNFIEFFRDVVMEYCRKVLPGENVDAAIDHLSAVEFFNYAKRVPSLTTHQEYLEQKLELEQKRLADREAQIELRDAEIKQKTDQIAALLNSKSYRIGQKIVKPATRTVNILKRGKK